jgi:hypothetical protein
MKKVVRLTENDLTRIIKRVIEEQSTTQKIDYKVLEKFLNAIDRGGSGNTSRWVLDSANPGKRQPPIILTGKEATILMDYVNKPLVWSLVVNGKKEKGAIFQIFSVKGKLYYQVYSSIKVGQQNSDGYEELTPKTVGFAIQKFNQRVFLQEPRY